MRLEDHDETEQARRCLDVWASVRRAIELRCPIPTFDAIFEAPATPLPAFFDERTQLWVTEWHEQYSSTTGDVLRRTAYRHLDNPAMMLYLSVEHVIMSLDDPEVFTPMLMRRFPRSGPYQTPVKDERRAATRQYDQRANWVCAAIVRQIGRAWKG